MPVEAAARSSTYGSPLSDSSAKPSERLPGFGRGRVLNYLQVFPSESGGVLDRRVAAENVMRPLVLFCVALLGMESLAYAQDQTLRGVYAPPGMGMTPSAPSGASTFAAPELGAIGVGPRVTISGEAIRGQRLPGDVSPAPIEDRPGYGRAIVNGRRAIIDLNTHRIVQVLD